MTCAPSPSFLCQMGVFTVVFLCRTIISLGWGKILYFKADAVTDWDFGLSLWRKLGRTHDIVWRKGWPLAKMTWHLMKMCGLLQCRVPWPGATFSIMMLWGGAIWLILTNRMRVEIMCIMSRPKLFKIRCLSTFPFASFSWKILSHYTLLELQEDPGSLGHCMEDFPTNRQKYT